MTAFRLAYLSLVRRPAPTLITVLSIAISVACSGLLLRLYHLSASRFDSLGRNWEAVIGAKAGGIEILLDSLNGEGPYPDYLPYVLFESLKAGQEVHFEDGHTSQPRYIKNVSPFLYFGQWHHFRVAGVDDSFVRAIAPLAEGHFPEGLGQVVLGENVARFQQLHLNQEIDVQPWLKDPPESETQKFKVVGILQAGGSAFDRMLFSTVEQGQAVVRAHLNPTEGRSIWGERVLNYFFVNLEPGGFTTLRNLINKRTVGQVVEVASTRQKLEELTGAGKAIGGLVSIFVILLSSLSVSSLLITRFEAMTVELAVLRAIGRSRRQVSAWLLWEGFLLGATGCLVGAALDAFAFPALRTLLASALPPPEVATSSLLESIYVWALALLATTFAIFIPLIRLYRQDVHESLKG